MKYLTTKNIVIALVIMILISLILIVYRMFFQFDQREIKIYVMDEAEKYTDKYEAYKIIMDSVNYILSSHNLTQQVIRASKINKTDLEQELVHSAIMHAKSFTYLPA
jgi:uncharacterized membrane protein